MKNQIRDVGGSGKKGQDPPSDIVMINANILTVDAQNSRAQALAIRGDRIVAVSTTRRIEKLVTKSTKVIDAKGKTLTPGFIDTHTHPQAIYPFKSRMHVVDLSRAKSLQEMATLLKSKTAITPPGQWVLGNNYRETNFGRHPNRDDLDKVSTRHLIWITHFTIHTSVVNSLVLRKAQIGEDTTDPEGGTLDKFAGHSKYPDGTPNGILFEKAQEFVLNRGVPPFPTASKDEEKAGLRKCMRELMIRNGVTSIGANTDSRLLALLQDMRAEDELPLRVNTMFQIGDDHVLLDSLRKIGLKSGLGDDRLRFGPLKLFAGNSRGARTCWLWDPYGGSHAGDDPPYYGLPHPLLWPEPARLDDMILKGHEAGFQWAVHSVGDREIDRLLDAFEKALRQCPRADHRHRIEHSSIMGRDKKILRRAKKLGVILNILSTTYESGAGYGDYGAARIAYMAPYRSAIDLGIRVSGHSDWPVSEAKPMLRIYDMVNRKSKEGIVFGPNQRITPEEAIHAWTMGGAYASFEEKIKGSIEAGKLADVVMLAEDPTKVDPLTIKDIEVEMTVLGGNIVYNGT